MADGSIRIEVLGDSAWFSKPGRSISYRITVAGKSYLIDVGASPFRPLGLEGLNNISAIFATHSHDDHRRWFTDLVLFMFYNPLLNNPLHLYATEVVHEEYHKNSKAALERSLSFQSDRLIDVPYQNFVQPHIYGARARFRIDKHPRDKVEGYVWRVYDVEKDDLADPRLAKVLINPLANRPRMIFRDPPSGHWVEPEAFYDFSDPVFYYDEEHFFDEKSGLRVKALKAPAWHGPPVVGLLLETETERVAFSSDTVFDPTLWRRMSKQVHEPDREGMSDAEFDDAQVIYGDINNFLQRTWSKRRFDVAMKAYNGSVVIHDADYTGSVVHTTYEVLAEAYSLGEVDWKRLVLCHTPDNYVSAFPVFARNKRYVCRDGDMFELVDDKSMELDADLYAKIDDRNYVGYVAPDGAHEVYREKGGLKIRPAGSAGTDDPPTDLRVRLYCDIEGHYFQAIDPTRQAFVRRPGGGYEQVTFEPHGSRGKPARDLRGTIRTAPRRRDGSKTGFLGRKRRGNE